MGCDKKVILAHWKLKVQWLVVFAIFGIVLAFTACDKDNVEEYPTLNVVNQNSDNYPITSIHLVGYDFENISIAVGSSQTFALDGGMPGGYKDIYIKVGFSYANTTGYVSTKVNFNKGENTTITFKGCRSGEGCSGLYLEYNP